MYELLTRVVDELRNAWRFRWYGVLVAWAVCVVGWLMVYSLPDIYTVEARVRIDTNSVIQPLISDLTVSPSADFKVALLISTVLSKPNLKEIARRTGLAIQATTPVAEEQLLARLGNRIGIDSLRRQVNLYGISYTGSDAQQARDIVQAVINIMTGMALGDDVQASEQAIGFLSRKVEDYRAKLYAAEEKLTEFKKTHPQLAQGQGYIGRLLASRAVLAQMQSKLQTLLNKRESLQQQLGEQAGGSVAVPISRSPELQALDSRIGQYQSELNQLLTQYTPQHPDVIRHKAIIERLQNKRQDLVAQLRANPQRIPGTSTAAYQQLQQRLDELEIEVNTLTASIDREQLQINVLSSSSGEATVASAKLADLQRNYDTIREQYETLLGRLNSARLSKDVATFSDPLDFRIVDPPEIPHVASGPPRMLFMFAVLLAGLGGGAVFALFMAQIRPVFLTRRRLQEVTGMPVLGAVSMAWSVRQRIQRRTNSALFALAVVGLMACFVAAVFLVPVGARLVSTILGRQWL